MATNTTADNKDIDFGQLSLKVKAYIAKTGDKVYDAILFFKKYFIIIIILIIAGVAYGIYSQEAMKKYKHEIIVIPNFDSVDYLYSEVKNLKTKINEPGFIKTSGITTPDNYVKFEVEPVVDLFNYLSDPTRDIVDNDRSYQIFKLLAENAEMEKLLEDGPIAKNFEHHKIVVYTKEKGTKQQIVDPVLKYLNSDPYYKQMQVDFTQNLELRMAANDSMIHQIDAIFDNLSTLSGKGTNLMYYNDETELYDVIRLKKKLILEQEKNRIAQRNYDKIIKESSVVLNISDTGIVAKSLKFIYPILLVLLFAGIVSFISFYKRQAAKRKITENA